jgi:hypothetical protein
LFVYVGNDLQGQMDALARGQTRMSVLGDFHRMIHLIAEDQSFPALLVAVTLNFALILSRYLHVNRHCHGSFPPSFVVCFL